MGNARASGEGRGAVGDAMGRVGSRAEIREEQRFRHLAENASDIIYLYRISPSPGYEYVSPSVTRITGFSPADHYADPELTQKIVHPSDRPLLTAMLQSPSAISEPVRLRLIHRDGTLVWTEHRIAAIYDATSNVVAIEGIARDVTEHTRAEEELRAGQERMRRLAMRMQVVAEASRAFAEAVTDHGLLLEVVARRVAALVGDTCSIRTVTDDGRWPENAAVYNPDPEVAGFIRGVLESSPQRTDEGLAAQVLRTGQPILVPHASVHDFRASLEPEYRAMLERIGMTGLVIVPMRARGRPVGVLTLVRHHPPGRPYREDDLALAQDLAERAALAISNARLFESLRHADLERRTLLGLLAEAEQKERRRLADDLHDDSIQVITAAVLRLQVFRRRTRDGRESEELDALEETMRHALDRLRHLNFELRPPALDTDGLSAALRSYLERWSGECGVRFGLKDRLVHEPSTEVRGTLYRVAQEALANVRKHAEARRVEVSMDERDGGYLLRVTDEGVGFDTRAAGPAAPGHLGLLAMRERAELAGGRWKLESRPGAGCRVECWIPDLLVAVTA